MLYFVTTFAKLEKGRLGWWERGSRRTVGYFTSLEDARFVVENNVCDLCETIYDYAIIEGIEEGLYPKVGYQELFKAVNTTVEQNGVHYYNPDLIYEPIQLPEKVSCTSIVIG